MIVAGCDVGSLTGKTVILKDGSILSYSIVPTTPKPEKTALSAMDEALKKCNLTMEDIQYLVGTGYGRVKIPFANENVSEITCHGKGAHWYNPSIRTIIDIGGQDLKVIRVSKEGKLVDFGAESGKEILDKFINMDDGAKYLGEVALVDVNSPIYKSGLIFSSILFDENASSHIALGAGYPSCLSNGSSLNNSEQLKNAGCNVSMVHTDFMIGTPKMEVTAFTDSGNVDIIKQGRFVI